jgi:lipopolysaccharide export system protein LptA
MNVIMVVKSFLPGHRWIGVGLSVLVLGAVSAAMAQSSMQGVPNAMQGFSQNRDQPIQIEAASLEVRDKQKEATFTGDVKVVQGDTTMKSKSLVVFYDGAKSTDQPSGNAPPAKGADKNQIKAAQPGPGGSSSIRRLEARGNVIVTQKDQVVTGDAAIFDTRSNLVTMQGGSGKVVLTKGKNVLRGDRLIVNMTTGTSRVESTSGPVQAVFDSAGSGQGGGAPTSIIPGGKK